MATSNGPVLLDFWVSPFGQSVRIAMAEKVIEYEYKEEDLFNKSALLLNSNPVHKKVPVLIHDGKTICESLIIMDYVDGVWSGKVKLLPSDSYQRAQARFWADFSSKVYECGTRVWKLKGEKQEAAKKEMIEMLKLFEAELGNKTYFGGDTFGFVDTALIPFTSWFYTYETFGNFSIKEVTPKIGAWAKRCMERESVAKALYEPNKVYEFVCFLKKYYGIE